MTLRAASRAGLLLSDAVCDIGRAGTGFEVWCSSCFFFYIFFSISGCGSHTRCVSIRLEMNYKTLQLGTGGDAAERLSVLAGSTALRCNLFTTPLKLRLTFPKS